ncbi:hypothetical protein V6N11_034265 [Hibiscus sabdariffa]|uniref:Uncharacterized protein n=1 Tax=Hibiscus sabdariffa TaxID=183260 RepID=A0ABR2N886_9ROSI
MVKSVDTLLLGSSARASRDFGGLASYSRFTIISFPDASNVQWSNRIIASSPGKEVHDPWAFYLYAALLRQAFAHCGKFPTAASRRSLGRVSVPVWLIILSDQLLIIALVSYCLTN